MYRLSRFITVLGIWAYLVFFCPHQVSARGVAFCTVKNQNGVGDKEIIWRYTKPTDLDTRGWNLLEGIRKDFEKKYNKKFKGSELDWSFTGSEYRLRGGYFVIIKVYSSSKNVGYYAMGVSHPRDDARAIALKRAKSSMTSRLMVLRLGKNDDQYEIIGEGKF